MSALPLTCYVRIAELEVDPACVEAVAVAAREVGQASVRCEEGCLVLAAKPVRDDDDQRGKRTG